MAEPADETVETEDEDFYALGPETMREVREAVQAEDRAALLAVMEPLHPADIADLLEQMDEAPRHKLIHIYGADFEGEILSELDESIREDVIETLSPAVLTQAVRTLESDDVVDLLEALEEPQQEAILDALERPDRIAIERALSFPEGSAGRLMQREVVAAPEHWTVGDAIDFMRASLDLPDQFYHIVLVDPRYRPIGHVTLGKVMSSRPGDAAAGPAGGRVPHHPGDPGRGGRGLCLQPVPPDLGAGGGRGQPARRRHHHRRRDDRALPGERGGPAAPRRRRRRVDRRPDASRSSGSASPGCW